MESVATMTNNHTLGSKKMSAGLWGSSRRRRVMNRSRIAPLACRLPRETFHPRLRRLFPDAAGRQHRKSPHRNGTKTVLVGFEERLV